MRIAEILGFGRKRNQRPPSEGDLMRHIGSMLNDSVKPYQAVYNQTTSSWDIIDQHTGKPVEQDLAISENDALKKAAEYNDQYFKQSKT